MNRHNLRVTAILASAVLLAVWIAFRLQQDLSHDESQEYQQLKELMQEKPPPSGGG